MPLDRRHSGKPIQGTPARERIGLASGLVALYALNEGSGAPVNCVTGVPAASNSATWSGSPYGPGLSFNGTSQYASLLNDAALNPPTALTVAVLASPAASATTMTLALSRDSSTGGWSFYLSASGALYYTVAAGGGSVGTSSSQADGGWHLFAASQSSNTTGGVQLYRDGMPVATGSVGAWPGTPGSGVARALGTNVTASSNWLRGSLALFAVWNRALFPGEHLALAMNPWQLFAPRPYYGLLKATAISRRFRRTLYDRAGSRGVL